MAHILVVDDDRATVSLLTLLLEMDGFQVSQSPQPQTVFELAKAGSVDAFIIDCHLGGFSGLDLVRDIRADADLADKLVFVTSGKDLAKEALLAGADLFDSIHYLRVDHECLHHMCGMSLGIGDKPFEILRGHPVHRLDVLFDQFQGCFFTFAVNDFVELICLRHDGTC